MLSFFSFRPFSLFVFCAALLAISPAHARTAGIETTAEFAYLMDSDTGAVLLDKRSNEAMNPSSMSKLMTLYVLFEQLKEGKITLETTFPVSETAWKKGGSKMFVGLGEQISVEDLIRGIIIQSGNDACIVVAEGIAGTEEAFAEMMNRTGRKLGLTQSSFANSTGWPDPNHLMSAKDIALLAHATIRDFPDYYPYFAEETFTYAGITQPNRNRLLDKGLGVDGLKTGHTDVAGYGISLSAKDPVTARRVVLVINGLDSDDSRINEGARLISYGLKAFENKRVVQQGQMVGSLPVWFGSQDSLRVVAGQDATLTMPKSGDAGIETSISAITPIKAPIAKGDKVGVLHVLRADQKLAEIPLLAAEDIDRATGFRWMNLVGRDVLLGGHQ